MEKKISVHLNGGRLFCDKHNEQLQFYMDYNKDRETSRGKPIACASCEEEARIIKKR